MGFKGASSFGSFERKKDFVVKNVTPITTEFSKGSVRGSIAAVNRESAWTRWRRGYELSSSSSYDNAYQYQFIYDIPFPSGTITPSGTNPVSTVSGAFKGFPTTAKEFGMHWAGVRRQGNMRTDELFDSVGERLSVVNVTEDNYYWYVQLKGTWSPSNPLPAPLYATVSGVTTPLKPMNGEILEDRVITVSGTPITATTINPNTQKRYGYVQAVLVDVDQNTGILKLKKAGSVEVTHDKAFLTPATKPPAIGRFLITGTRYACTCQDFTHRDYFFMSSINDTIRKYFPYSSVTSIKPGRYEDITLSGQLDNNTTSHSLNDRIMNVVAPSATYQLLDDIAISEVNRLATRDNPGVFRDFGATYVRSITDPSLPGNTAEGMPVYTDYSQEQNVITNLGDNWAPVLDEMRYCKHIYAMKFEEHVFPPEPSDFPVGMDSMAEWEQKLVQESENNQKQYQAFNITKKALSYMDVPPYNCQSPVMAPMLQKLFNIPNQIVSLSGFRMIDKTGHIYIPASGEKPSV